MMGEASVPDAVSRAKRMPGLAVGLHITLTSGHAVLPVSEIPDLVDKDGRFDDNMVRAGIKYFFFPKIRKQLEKEIRAQFEAFQKTGLFLDHVNTHRHFHLHPTLIGLILKIGHEYGLESMRIPHEPRALLGATPSRLSILTPIYSAWVKYLSIRLKKLGITANDFVFGLNWSGAMTETRILHLIQNLPLGLTEIYLHPATSRSDKLKDLMPDYQHVVEFQALISPAVKTAVRIRNIELVTYGQMSMKVE